MKHAIKLLTARLLAPLSDGKDSSGGTKSWKRGLINERLPTRIVGDGKHDKP
jgi:hypothetical protein